MLIKLDYILGCKEKLNNFQKVNVTLFTFFDLTLHLGFNNKYRKKSSHLENPHAHIEIPTSNSQLKKKHKKSKIKSLFKDNDNKNMTSQNLWDQTKVVIRGKFIALKVYC